MFPNLVRLAIVLFFIACSTGLKAQPVLPDIAGASDKGIIVLSWISQFDGVKSIAVQRSSDSAVNYATVGYVKNLKKGRQAFIDGHPLPGNNWYRLFIAFNSDLTWQSNRFKLYVDSATLAAKRVLPPNDSLQKLAVKIKIDTNASPAKANTSSSITPATTPPVVNAPKTTTINTTTTNSPVVTSPVADPENPADTLLNIIDKLVITIPDPNEINSYTYVKSEYVFTNPFTGHINMELPDIKKHKYSIQFFDDKDKKVLELLKVSESPLILDKRNFQKKGLYRFELMKNKEKLETGYITIY